MGCNGVEMSKNCDLCFCSLAELNQSSKSIFFCCMSPISLCSDLCSRRLRSITFKVKDKYKAMMKTKINWKRHQKGSSSNYLLENKLQRAYTEDLQTPLRADTHATLAVTSLRRRGESSSVSVEKRQSTHANRVLTPADIHCSPEAAASSLPSAFRQVAKAQVRARSTHLSKVYPPKETD